MAEANMGQPHRATQFTPTTVAFLVPGDPAAKTICAIELYCYTRNAAPVQLPVWIYDRAPSGAPGNPLASGTMLVDTAAAVYRASIRASLPAGADFFIAFDNAAGNLAPPVSRTGVVGTHYHSGPNWAGPYGSGAWMYRVYDDSGVQAATFTTVGSGCAGSLGVPRIGNVGQPVTGSIFQVTLANAPATGPVAHVIGTVATALDLGPLGAPGCTAEQLPIVALPRSTTPTGAAAVAYRVPADPALIGAVLRMQWVVVDPPANPLGVVVSKGGVAQVGDF